MLRFPGLSKKASYSSNLESRTAKERLVKLLACFGVFLVLGGCAQLPTTPAAHTEKPVPAGEIISFVIPPDALGARDAELSGVLYKAGELAAAQKHPTTILITALGQDFSYLNQAIWRGVPAQHPARLSLENQTAGANEPYSVVIKTTTQ